MSPTCKALLTASAALALGACASMPAPLQGTFTQVDQAQATQPNARGVSVRWGGQIISTEPQAQSTCFFVLARPLDNIARPRIDANSNGRFVACHAGFYDPEVYAKGREVSFTGTLDGSVERKVGQYAYTYPKIDASTVYLWPEHVRMVYRDPFYSPFYDPFYNPWYNPWWNRPRVIVVRPPHHPHPHPRPPAHK